MYILNWKGSTVGLNLLPHQASVSALMRRHGWRMQRDKMNASRCLSILWLMSGQRAFSWRSPLTNASIECIIWTLLYYKPIPCIWASSAASTHVYLLPSYSIACCLVCHLAVIPIVTTHSCRLLSIACQLYSMFWRCGSAGQFPLSFFLGTYSS